MKSEERHRLQQNALADWIGKTVESIKPYQNTILFTALAIVVGVVIYSWWTRVSVAESAKAWEDLNVAMESGNTARMAKVIETYPKTDAAHMAAVLAGDFHLAEGCDRRFVSKAIANDELNAAVTQYKNVLEQSRNSSLMERATFGMARAREAKGDLEPAGKLYADVLHEMARRRLCRRRRHARNDLKRTSTKEFYDRFKDFDPKPAFSGEGDLPGKKPSFDLDTLPSDAAQDLKFGGKDKGQKDTSKAPTEEKPAAGEKKPADEEKPADEKKTPEEAGK